jgi:glycopeptide antibiotics resistance protein
MTTPIRHWRTAPGRAARAVVRSLALLLLVLSVLEMLLITLVPTPGSVTYSHPNMHPFATIRLYLREGTVEEQFLQIGGNIALGFVLGFLLPQITPYLRGLLRVEVVTAVLIAVVELVQHLFISGTTINIDDLILAGAGAAVGYFPLGRMFGMRLHPHHLHWWQRILARLVERRSGRSVHD